MYKKIVFLLLVIIIISSTMLIYKINQSTKYDPEIYAQVYKEYEHITNISSESQEFEETTNASTSTTTSKEPIIIYKNSLGTTYRTIGTLSIPKINLSYPVINDYSETNLNIAPTKFVGPKPNHVGNFVIVGHNNWNREFFSNLHKLEENDIVKLTDVLGNTKTYKVYDIYEVKQNDFSCLDQNTNGKVELTLITCIKHQKSKRLIVKCIAT